MATNNKHKPNKLFQFFIELKRELEKVSWPTKNTTIKLTLVVISVSVAVGLYLGGLDYLFTWIMGLLLNTN